jgi:hypothetical protein
VVVPVAVHQDQRVQHAEGADGCIVRHIRRREADSTDTLGFIDSEKRMRMIFFFFFAVNDRVDLFGLQGSDCWCYQY